MNDSSILVSVKNKVQIVQLNRPKKKNAFSISMYTDLTNILNEAAIDDNIIVTVLTGSGDYYSSGNDITSFLQMPLAPSEDSPFRQAKYRIQSFVEAFINFPKILIAVLNGPAIGIAATTLALCDVVYASETAFFQTPFIKLGLSPEGCSTYTFPKMFGTSKASEILLFGRKISSEEALKYGLIAEIYSSDIMLENIWNKIYSLPSLPQESLMNAKRLLKNFDKDYLLLANIKECNELEERWKSEECINAVMKFASGSSKL